MPGTLAHQEFCLETLVTALFSMQHELSTKLCFVQHVVPYILHGALVGTNLYIGRVPPLPAPNLNELFRNQDLDKYSRVEISFDTFITFY